MDMKEWAKREIEIACKKERGDGDPDVCFKEDENGPSFVEITREEYEERMKKDSERNGK